MAREHEVLSMSSVINGNVELNADVLYASYMKYSDFTSEVSNLQSDLSTHVNSISGELDYINTTLSSTGESKQFFTGEEAQKNITDVNSVNDTIENVNSTIKSLESLGIESDIETYNKNLEAMKNGARLKLLRIGADEYNSSKTVKDVQHLSNMTGNITAGDHYYKGFVDYTITDIKDNGKGRDGLGCDYTKTNYDYINYWGWIKSDPDDWHYWLTGLADIKDIDKFEEKFIEKGIPLPYDKSLIIEADESKYSGGGHSI